MRTEEARRLRPGARVLCPADREEPPRQVVVVSVATEPQEDLFGDPFLWVTVRDPQKGVHAVFPSHLLTATSARVPEAQTGAQGDLFGDPSPVT